MSGPQTIQREIRSSSVAKLENGYTRIANELLEALARYPLTARQHRIVNMIMRFTYGYQQRTAFLSTKKIAEACDLNQGHSRKIIAELLELRVLFREGGQKGVIGINNHIEEWRFATKSVANKSSTFATKLVANPATNLVANPATNLVANPPNTPYKKKKNIKEEGKESETPSIPPVDFSGIQPRHIVEIWNRQRPGSAISPILPPKQQSEIVATLHFLAETFGQERWPKHADDVLPWFSDFFASIESGEQGKYLKERDFFYFMDSSRLYQSLEDDRHG